MGKPHWANPHLTLWELCNAATGVKQVPTSLHRHGFLGLGYVRILIILWPAGAGWEATVAHVSHTLCASDRPYPENDDESKGFLYWHTPELCSLFWPHPVFTDPKPVCLLEQMIIET